MDPIIPSQAPLTKKQRRELKRQEKERVVQEAQSHARRNRSTLWLLVAVLVVWTIGGLVWFTQRSSADTTNTEELTVDEISTSDWKKGNPDAKVTLIEYSDLQCPACGYYAPIVRQIVAEYEDKISFAYRHYPLIQIHQNAEKAATAAEAAGLQGRFWDYHDLLFSRQASWSSERNPDSLFEEYAKSLGLNVEKFKSDYASDAVKLEVANDTNSGRKARVEGTPTFFLNGKKITNPKDYTAFKKVIDEALSK